MSAIKLGPRLGMEHALDAAYKQSEAVIRKANSRVTLHDPALGSIKRVEDTDLALGYNRLPSGYRNLDRVERIVLVNQKGEFQPLLYIAGSTFREGVHRVVQPCIAAFGITPGRGSDCLMSQAGLNATSDIQIDTGALGMAGARSASEDNESATTLPATATIGELDYADAKRTSDAVQQISRTIVAVQCILDGASVENALYLMRPPEEYARPAVLAT